MKILLVEDDPRIAQAVAEALTDQRYVVELATDGELGLAFAESQAFDLIILDVMLPRLDGITLCRKLRNLGLTTPIIMLTARDTSEDKVLGLDVGADDYVVKPFDLPEFLARIRALLRRGTVAPSSLLEWEKLTLNPDTYEVVYDGVSLALTPKEYSLLELLLRHGSRVLSRSTILEQVWAYDDMPAEETIKVHVRSLRQKLKVAGAEDRFIENVYGLGYRLNPHL
ncbi:MAG: response regulator transcription factor [Leptolyngbya sp.]|nr:response regulator transcription factor [Leptolyngbya sp.]